MMEGLREEVYAVYKSMIPPISMVRNSSSAAYASGSINRLWFGSKMGYFFPGVSILVCCLSVFDAS